MSSLWELSTDTVVTALIVAGISLLALAWLFAGRRRPQSKRSALEQRRLAGREAEVFVAPEAPSLTAAPPAEERPSVARTEAPAPVAEAAPEPATPPNIPQPQAGIDIQPMHQVEVSAPARPPATPEPAAEPTLILKPSAAAPPSADPKPAATPAPAAPRSAEQASAMSIAAALVRHDKRDAPSSKLSEDALQAEPPSCVDGDDLTAIGGIDDKLAKEMNDLGVRYYDQISDWAPDYAAWIASRLSASVTSAQRNAWSEEARALANQPPATGPSHASRGR